MLYPSIISPCSAPTALKVLTYIKKKKKKIKTKSLSHTQTPGGLLLPVEVYDVLHQEVPLQAVDSVAVQHHLVAA